MNEVTRRRFWLALAGAYALALLALFYPLIWAPVWELSERLANLVNSIPWSSPSAKLVILITVVLTITGGLGGLAVQVGRGGLIMPRLVKETSGSFKFEPGFLGETFLGAVAGNALHFPFSAMVQYQNLSSGTQQTQSWLTLAALGILGGYAGGVLLKRWSDSLVNSLAKGLEENKKLTERALSENENLRRQRQQFEDELLLDAIFESSITNRRLDTTASTILEARAKQIIRQKSEAGMESIEPIDALFAAYKLFAISRYGEAAEFLEHTLKASDVPKRTWSIRNLLGLCYHYRNTNDEIPNWYEIAKSHYEETLSLGTELIEKTVPLVNLGYLETDKGNYTAALKHFANVRDKRTQLIDYPKIIDAGSLGAARAHTLMGNPDNAAEALNEIRDIDALGYLFKDGTIEVSVIEKWKNVESLMPAIKTFLEKF